MPKVSIIIPTYNRADLLPRAVQSVINQTYKDWELLIVDDGSADNTKEVVEKFAKKDPRIKYFYKENGGQGSARNLGIKNARGEWILPLDSDDALLPDGVEKLLSATQKQSADIVWGKTWRVAEEGRKILGIGGATPSSVLLRRKIFLDYGFYDEDRNLIAGEDVDHLYRLQPILENGSIHLISINEPVAIYFLHTGQSTSLLKPDKLLIKADAMIQKWNNHEPKGLLWRTNMAHQWRNKGVYEILLGRKSDGLKSLEKSMTLRRSLGTAVLWCAGCFGRVSFVWFILPIRRFFENGILRVAMVDFLLRHISDRMYVKNSVAFIKHFGKK